MEASAAAAAGDSDAAAGDPQGSVYAQLVQTGNDGLDACRRAFCMAELCPNELTWISKMFAVFATRASARCNRASVTVLDRHAAALLTHIIDLLHWSSWIEWEAQAWSLPVLAELNLLQRHAQDVVVLACSRGIDLVILQGSKGVPQELANRLEAAFPPAVFQDIGLWSKLGNAKFQRFNKDRGRRDVPDTAAAPNAVRDGDHHWIDVSAQFFMDAARDVPDTAAAPNVVRDGCHHIDVSTQFMDAAREGLGTCRHAKWLAKVRPEELMFISQIFARVVRVVRDARPFGPLLFRDAEDEPELQVASCMRHIDELLTQQEAQLLPWMAVGELMALQQHTQDVVLLACIRGLGLCQMLTWRWHPVPPELLDRLVAAFTATDLQDGSLWSRLGMAYQRFIKKNKFGSRHAGICWPPQPPPQHQYLLTADTRVITFPLSL